MNPTPSRIESLGCYAKFFEYFNTRRLARTCYGAALIAIVWMAIGLPERANAAPIDYSVAYGELVYPVKSNLNGRTVDGLFAGYVRLQSDPGQENYGHFVNEAGRVKFVGVNIASTGKPPTTDITKSPWPRSQAEAEETAARLASLGINAVRFNKLLLPAPVGLLTVGGSALELDAKERFVRFVRALKAKNIYIFLSFCFGGDDKVPGHPDFPRDGAHTAFGALDSAVAATLQSQIEKVLMMDIDPYTDGGQPLIRDPVLALVAINNENSLLEAWTNGRIDGRISKIGGAKTDPSWTEAYWPGSSPAITYKAKLLSLPGASAYRDVYENGNNTPKWNDHSDTDKANCLKWLCQTEATYNSTMIDFVKNLAADERGNSALLPVTGGQSAWGAVYADRITTQANGGNFSKFDFYDDHLYYSLSDTEKIAYYSKQRPMLQSGNSSGYGNLAAVASRRVKNSPFVVSECALRGPHVALADYSTILAYAAAQDWDGVFFFYYTNSNTQYGADPEDSVPDGPLRITGQEILVAHPTGLAAIAAGAQLFRGKAITAFTSEKFIKVRRSTLNSKMNGLPSNMPSADLAWNDFMDISAYDYALRYKIGMEIVPDAADTFFTTPPDVWENDASGPGQHIKLGSNTLSYYRDRFVRFDTTKAKGYAGFYDTNNISAFYGGGIFMTVDESALSKVCDAGTGTPSNAKAYVNISFCSLNGNSTENWALPQAILITALGQCRNSGPNLNATTLDDFDNPDTPEVDPKDYPPYTYQSSYGLATDKSQVDEVFASITFPVTYDAAKFKFYKCSPNGLKTQLYSPNITTPDGSHTTVWLGDTGTGGSIWYYVEYTP